MTANNGLLVDVDIESNSIVEDKRDKSENSANTNKLTLEGANEVNSNVASNRNIFDAIDTIQTYQNNVEIENNGANGIQRERMNSVDSTHSIRASDSTGWMPASHPKSNQTPS